MNQGLERITVTNRGVTFADNGVIGQCGVFNGSSCISCSNPSISGSNISASLWLYFTTKPSSSSYYYILSLNTNSGYADQSIAIALESQGLIFVIGGSTTIYANIQANQWNHVALTFDGSTMKGYVNGAVVATATKTPFNRSNLTIGARYNGSGYMYYFNGKLNDVRIYDNCITEEDVKRLYNCKLMDISACGYNNGFFYDNSGLNINKLVSTAVTYSGNSMYFNGTTSQIRPEDGKSGLNISGGTLSVWFTPTTKPTDNRIVYIDSKSHMAIGFYSSGNYFIVTCNGTAFKTFSTANLVYNQLNHVVVTYNNTPSPQNCYINGISASTGSTNNWTETSGITIGGRTSNVSNKYKGYISKVTVYKNQLSESEIVGLYASGCDTSSDFSDNYTRLEYIQSTGTQWIDTGVYGHMNHTYEIEYQMNDTGNYRTWGVFGQSSYVGYNMSFTYSNNWAIRWESESGKQRLVDNISTKNTNKHTIKIANGNVYLDGVSKGISTGHNSNCVIPYNLYLFTVNPANTEPSANAKVKIFSYKDLNSESELVMDMIPAKRKSDNVLGMYDMVSKTFFTNAGTGTFTAGPEF